MSTQLYFYTDQNNTVRWSCVNICVYFIQIALQECPGNSESDWGQPGSIETLSVTKFICREHTKGLSQMLCSFLESGFVCFLSQSVFFHEPWTTRQEHSKHSTQAVYTSIKWRDQGHIRGRKLTQSGIQIRRRGPLSLSPLETRFHSLCLCPSQRRDCG